MVFKHKHSPLTQKVLNAITPLFVSNAHMHHIAALGITLEELSIWGAEYATGMIHDVSGFLVFVLAFILLYAAGKVLE